MKNKKDTQKRLANTFMEYTTVLGIVFFTLVAMNTYIKRGIQGRLAEMSDYFISPVHVTEVTPKAVTTSTSNVISQDISTTEGLMGGGTRLDLPGGTKNTSVESVVTELDPNFSGSFVPGDEGDVIAQERGDDEDYVDPDLEKEAEIEELRSQKEGLLQEANMKETTAAQLQAEGQNLIYTANHMDCDDDDHSCKRARRKMRQAGQELLARAAQLNQEVAELRAEAVNIQNKIDQLCQEIGGCA